MTIEKSWHIPGKYQIEVHGELGSEWTHWFDGMSIISIDGVTTIISDFMDQSALFGLLNKVADLGLPLISLRRIASSGNDQH